MRRVPWASHLWPGLPQVWYGGSWSALALACGFAVLLNLLLAATFVWTDLLSGGLRTFGWVAVCTTWAFSGGFSRWWEAQAVRRHRPPAPDLFPRALEEYLKGNWSRAEDLLRALLRDNPADVDAGLMLVGVFRRTERWEAAREQIRQLERWEMSAKWRLEIEAEKVRIAPAQRVAALTDGDASAPPSAAAPEGENRLGEDLSAA